MANSALHRSTDLLAMWGNRSWTVSVPSFFNDVATEQQLRESVERASISEDGSTTGQLILDNGWHAHWATTTEGLIEVGFLPESENPGQLCAQLADWLERNTSTVLDDPWLRRRFEGKLLEVRMYGDSPRSPVLMISLQSLDRG